MPSGIWSRRLINQHSFAAAAEFATDQGADGRHTDDSGDHSNTSSSTIVAAEVSESDGFFSGFHVGE
jgi:nitrous oxide reductase